MPFALGPIAASRGYRLVAFDEAGSTNTEAMARARAGERGPVWYVTTLQTAGRGRRHRPWVAPRGNLASSILEVIQVAPTVAATLGFAAGLALDSALRSLSGDGPEFSLKWPNDVLANSHKLSGILLEAESVGDSLAVVVGIGTNVVAAPEYTPRLATSLHALGINVEAETLFAALSDGWAEYRGIWDNGRGFAEIRRLWLARAAGLGQAVAIKSGGTEIEGTFDTIDEQGCMIVRTAAGTRVPITAGDVYFGTAASAGVA
jgi:BirA family transcriptional regulator, biotin operon repressor / biotin---[acetyl-CoA-carboxylase] ligase